MKGSFNYDEKTRKLTLKRDDGRRAGVLDISLSGDTGSVIFSQGRQAKQYANVQLWTDAAGECEIATANGARDKQINLGKWCAYILAIFSPLSRFGLWVDSYLTWAFKRLVGKPQPLRNGSSDNRNTQKKYKYPKRGAFIPEFSLYWRHLRYHAVRGWLFAVGIVLGFLIGDLLV